MQINELYRFSLGVNRIYGILDMKG